MGRALKHAQIRRVQLKFSLFECLCAQSRGLKDIMSLLIHSHTLNGWEGTRLHNAQESPERLFCGRENLLSHLKEKWDTQGPHVVVSFIGLPHTNLKVENDCFYHERVDSRNHSFTPYRIPPCVFLQSHLHFAQSEKAKSKAPLLQSTTRFPLHLAGRALK